MTDPIRDLAICCVRDDDPIAFLAILDLLEEEQDQRVPALRSLDFDRPFDFDRVFAFRNAVVGQKSGHLVVRHSMISGMPGQKPIRCGAVLPIDYWNESIRDRLLRLGAVGPASCYAVDPEGSYTTAGWVPSAREAAGSHRLFYHLGLRKPALPEHCFHCRQADHLDILVRRYGDGEDTPFDVRNSSRDLRRAVLITQFPHLANALAEI